MYTEEQIETTIKEEKTKLYKQIFALLKILERMDDPAFSKDTAIKLLHTKELYR